MATKKPRTRRTTKKAAVQKTIAPISKTAAVVSHIVEGTGEVQSDLYVSCVKAEALFEMQDEALFQIRSIAKLAEDAIHLDDDLAENDSATHAANALAVIACLAGKAMRESEEKRSGLADEEVRVAA